MSKIINLEEYNKEEEYKYLKSYIFIKGFAVGKNLSYTLKALPLARKLHDEQYRKGGDPYIMHPLKVCSTLISLGIMDDITLACALLHDVVEDNPDSFPEKGVELMKDYGFPQEVYEIILLLSKESGLDEIALSNYFNNIKLNWKALIIKLADRSHNSETMHVMKLEKIHKYLNETRTYFLPMMSYGKINYPELSNSITILKSKIISLCNVTEILLDKLEEK